MNGLTLGLDLTGASIALMAVRLLWDVSVLMQTATLKRAWRALTCVILCCVMLHITSAIIGFGQETDAAKLSNVGIHMLGASFVLAVSWLSRRTATDLLRITALEEAAFRDALTSLGNRRRFDERLQDDVRRVRHAARPLSLILLDIDNFKRINDTYGHKIGDLVLKQMADVISTQTRPIDTLCRIGGEEFAIIAPGMDAPFAASLAEGLRLSVSDCHFLAEDRAALRCTISLGIATMHGDEIGDDLFCRADAALYASKRSGRDRVSLAA